MEAEIVVAIPYPTECFGAIDRLVSAVCLKKDFEIKSIAPVVVSEEHTKLGIVNIIVNRESVEVISQVESCQRQSNLVVGSHLEVSHHSRIRGKEVRKPGRIAIRNANIILQ